MSNSISNGFWSVATQKHLCQFQADSPNYSEFETLNMSGKSGRLLGLVRGNSRIENMPKIEKLAGSIGIGKKELKTKILPELEKVTGKKIELIRNTVGEIVGIEEYFLTSNEVLDASGNYFDYLEPDKKERIMIESLASTKELPTSESEMYSLLSSSYNEEDIKEALVYQEQFKLINNNKINNDIIYTNEYMWGNKQEKLLYPLQRLDIVSREELETFINFLQKTQGANSEQIALNQKLLTLAKSTGIINPITLRTKRDFSKDFLFTSNFLGGNSLNDDIMDDLKLLISAIKFGSKFTLYTRLNDPILFLRRLVSGCKVGPHSANGTDYVLLESRGIIKVTESKEKPGRFYMELIKKDVGKMALEILESSDLDLESSVPRYDFSVNQEEASIYYETPELSRLKMAKLPADSQEAAEYFIETIRNERL